MKDEAGGVELWWLATAWLRSRGLTTTLAVLLLVAVAGALAADVTLRLPYVRRSLPVPLALVALTGLVIAIPLQNRFGDLERSFPRGTAERGFAGCLVCALAAAACVPAGLSAVGAFPWRLLFALMAATVVAVVLVGPFAWLAPLVLGLAVMYVDLQRNAVITSALNTVGMTKLVLALVVALLVFAARGPARA